MREIKFRVFDKVNREMIQHEEVCKLFYIPNLNNGPNKYFTPFMQYTGLKDKNGHEIYEGDIIRILDDEEFDGWNEEIIFHRSCFVAGDDNLLVNVHFRSIVKGNIYENPELRR